MKPSPESEGARWLEQAGRDLDDARFALQGQRYNLACFLGQQAAEKALEGYLYAQGEEAVWGHSVADLGREAAAFDPDFESLRKQVAVLDKYYIPTRYPNGLPGGIPSDAFDRDDGEKAIALATETIRVVKSKMDRGHK